MEFTEGKVSNTEKGECEASPSSLSTQYGYKSYDTVNNTETEIIISTSNPKGKNAYLKYALTNGVVVDGTVPEACIYSESYGGELCLKSNEFATSAQKIKTYFGYKTTGEGAWTNTSSYNWENADHTITCFVNASNFANASNVYCSDSVVSAGANGDGGYVNAIDYSAYFGCDVYVDGSAACGQG